MIVLVVNCGSSSIKYRLYNMPEGALLTRGSVDRIGVEGSMHTRRTKDSSYETPVEAHDHKQGMDVILAALTDRGGVIKNLAEIQGVGHRVVHGGESFTGSVHITEEVLNAIETNSSLAPLHNPPNLTGIRAADRSLPHAVQVACFDTAFHARIPRTAHLYAVPLEWYERHGIRRYGFHGTSHRYVARRAARMLGRHKYDLNAVTCHLGNGCSIAAVKNGYSVDTSMGMTPLEGLVMGTRSGDIDPAIVFYLLDKGYAADEIENILNKKSGLLGLSGFSNDMRTLLREAKDGNERADRAIDVFSYRVRKYIGAYLAVLGEVHCVVFTAGIGERAPEVRSRILRGFDELGIVLSEDQNRKLQGEGLITSDESRIPVFVIPTDEERAIAADTYEIAERLKNSHDG